MHTFSTLFKVSGWQEQHLALMQFSQFPVDPLGLRLTQSVEISCDTPHLLRVQCVHIFLPFSAFAADESLYTEQSANNSVYVLFNIGMYLFCTLPWLRIVVFIFLFSQENGKSVFIYEYVSNLHITFTSRL
jgi:hypothetical protein